MSINQSNGKGTGYLTVRVSTALGAIPLDKASVNIRGSTPETSGIVYSLQSDRDGLTERVALPTPSLYASAAPDRGVPYSMWSIDIFREGYSPVYLERVPVYPSVTSVQSVAMVPLPEGFAPQRVYVEARPTDNKEEA